MEKTKKLPISFFEKSRPDAPKDTLKKLISFKWSDEKKIKGGKYKNKKIINLPKAR